MELSYGNTFFAFSCKIVMRIAFLFDFFEPPISTVLEGAIADSSFLFGRGLWPISMIGFLPSRRSNGRQQRPYCLQFSKTWFDLVCRPAGIHRCHRTKHNTYARIHHWKALKDASAWCFVQLFNTQSQTPTQEGPPAQSAEGACRVFAL